MKTELIDQHLGEAEQLLLALVFIVENTDDSQHDLMQHAAVTIAWVTVDKIRQSLEELAGTPEG